MPSGSDFGEVVKDSLNALLTDLQNTTEVLKKAHLSNKHEHDEPIYQPQRARVGNMSSTNGLQDLEKLLDDYDEQRTPAGKPESRLGRPTVESLLGELDNAVVHNGDARRPNPNPNPSASTASKDLDNLMASLHDFKVTSNTQEAASPSQHTHHQPVEETHLDSMMGTLQDDMTRYGIHTIPKGNCGSCSKTIVGQVIIALAKMWHPSCFVCAHCNEELGHRNFFERSAKAYCENCYHTLFSPRCAYCNGPIKDKCVNAVNKTWHPECFCCAQCGTDFGEDGFHEKESKAFCRKCYFSMFAPRCRACTRPISDNYITALKSQWHPECFVCQECKSPFAGGSFFDHDGHPYCEMHYHAKRGSLCAGCTKPISGRCVTAMQNKFHPECFTCSFCNSQLNKGTFKEHQHKPFCHKCFEKLLS